MTEARIAPMEPPYTEAVATALERLMPAGVPPLVLFRTLAVNERVFSRMLAGGLLDKGTVSLRERELVIDRTCWRCGSEYEWGVHVAFFGERVRLTPEEVQGLCTDDPEATPFSPRERLLLRLCDELHASATVSDALWAELAREWTPSQLLELLALAGYYHAISYVTNALRLPLESFAARFPINPSPPDSSRGAGASS
ncbi:carboxymuconolactone decarboxylase family protein [Pyxidicoccus fallax]|uniref:Carboxymuconolactone decarboxylase family protein n=1 Tax=Pyxidicoccus fallax TaxID=394095 RepID=A0A848LE16_9BACT|nr:carboxymuconolactone decarboxylase family protein [Pyxidicoccus fallax]NMO16686.1 carboxymuconolactone decarboxylase family protein [Pyxidicoccus fallax]NPC79251.1 carboxymuconolactone decarboxylase family protein [Pyxidicoccus fallax]